MTQQQLPRCPVCGFEIEGEVPSSGEEGSVFCPARYCGVELRADAEGGLRTVTFRLVNHYTLCVLPFSFSGAGGAPTRRLEKSGRWTERRFSLDSPEDVDRTEYFLSYVRRFLFPSLFESEDPAGRSSQGPRAEPTCRHYEFDLSRLSELEGDGVPMTLQCCDTRKALDYRYRLVLEGAQLVVFHYGVGFLVLRFRCADPEATFFDQMGSAKFLRPIAPLYRGFAMPELSTKEQAFGIPQLLPYLLAEFGPRGKGKRPASPADFAPDAPLPVRPVHDDRMMVYSFNCLDKETCLDNERQCRKLLYQHTVVHFEREPAERSEADPEAAFSQWLRTRWQGFSKDGGCLTVFNTDGYHERFIGTYFGTYYFDIFLLAALQRVTLLSLFERLSDIDSLTTGGRASHKRLRRVRFDLLLFKNQCWFSQISNRERGLVFWRKWQEVFENRTLLDEVNEQSEELDTYLRNRTRERVEWLVRLGGFVATTVPAVLGMNILFGDHPWVDHLKWILLVLLVAGTGLFALLFAYRQRNEF